MSEENKRNQEPWSWRRGSAMDAGMNEVIVDADANVVCATCPQSEEESARRIVACVNACAGIPTVALERDRLAQAFESLRRIRALSEDPVARADAASALQTLGLPF